MANNKRLHVATHNSTPYFYSDKIWHGDEATFTNSMYVDMVEGLKGNMSELGFQLFQPHVGIRRWMFPLMGLHKDLIVKTPWGEDLKIVDPMSVLIYDPVDDVDGVVPLQDLSHWPVAQSVYWKTYTFWQGELVWEELNQMEKFLNDSGMIPVTKGAPVMAMYLTEDVYITGLEHEGRIVHVPAGDWLMIGVDGEPYHTTDADFRKLYQV